MKDHTELDEVLPRKLEDASPSDFVRLFMRFVCFPDGSLKNGKSKPDTPVLQPLDIGKLTNDDLEAFAKIYVENNPYLYKKREHKRKRNDADITVVTPYLGDVELPRADDESYAAYLLRLTLLERARQREQMEAITKSFSGFSGGLADSLRKNLSHGDELKRAMLDLRQQIPESDFLIEPNDPGFDRAEMQHNAVKVRRAPFDDLVERLDQLVDSSIESSKFMVESNAIQAQVAEEIKKSGDTASSFSGKNFKLSIGIILLAFLGTVATAYSIYNENKQDGLRQSFYKDALQELNGNLQSLSDAISRDNTKSQAVLNEQLGTLKNFSDELETFGRGQKYTKEQIGEVKRENGELKAELMRLRNNFQNIEKSEE